MFLARQYNVGFPAVGRAISPQLNLLTLSQSITSTLRFVIFSSDRLDLCAVVESWHNSADSPQLIAYRPLGFQHIEKARPQNESAMQTMLTNHDGIRLFQKSVISAREMPLPVFKS